MVLVTGFFTFTANSRCFLVNLKIMNPGFLTFTAHSRCFLVNLKIMNHARLYLLFYHISISVTISGNLIFQFDNYLMVAPDIPIVTSITKNIISQYSKLHYIKIILLHYIIVNYLEQLLMNVTQLILAGDCTWLLNQFIGTVIIRHIDLRMLGLCLSFSFQYIIVCITYMYVIIFFSFFVFLHGRNQA